ncbi:type II toxin-antitoxin system prevent-host-death family antitoxin [Sinorhizobium meliloti]|uniref:Antitoxin n=1 Tax=Rhizobium meliloti TaxID=382 RepID=A0A2J0YWW2_RHIML|nr:type II toxin-antitoxin system prevent-host-death family antitoxin [Sinorhizobium meliloti]PJR12772.1 prevent-host-death protein [Sinorhizobium meliloti]
MTSIVTAAAVSESFEAYQDAAMREPVIITENGRPRTVLLAYEDYLRLSRRDRRVEAAPDLSDEDLAAVEKAEQEPGLDHLNAELLTDKHAADSNLEPSRGL